MELARWFKLEERSSSGAADPTVNHVELVGFLGREVELRYTQQGVPVALLSVATHRWWRAPDGPLVELTDWHRVVAWEELAERCKGLSRGALVRVVGQLRTRSWDTQRGERKMRTEIIARRIEPVHSATRPRQVPLPLASALPEAP